MSYEKQNFTSGMLLTADHLNHMEEGIVNASTQTSGGTQSDWSINDESNNAYVKNRTHYCEVSAQYINAVWYNSFNFSYDSSNSCYNSWLTDKQGGVLSNGMQVSICWDDNYDYNLTAYTYQGNMWTGRIVVGNPSILDSTLEDTGEPFLVIDNQSLGFILYTKQTESVHTFQLNYLGEKKKYHRLEEGYIPDMTELRLISSSGQVYSVTVSDDGTLSVKVASYRD